MEYKVGQKVLYQLRDGVFYEDTLKFASTVSEGVFYTSTHVIGVHQIIEVLADKSIPYEVGELVEYITPAKRTTTGRITSLDVHAGAVLIDGSFFVFLDEILQKVDEEVEVENEFTSLHASLLSFNETNWYAHAIDQALLEGNEALFHTLVGKKEVVGPWEKQNKK